MTYTPPQIKRCECGDQCRGTTRDPIVHHPTDAERKAQHWGDTVTLYRDRCVDCRGVR